MKKIYIFQTGHSFSDMIPEYGDFDDWIIRESGETQTDFCAVDVLGGEPLPDYESCGGVIITGSHAMVTDNLDWSLAIEAWLRGALEHEIPVLGICYGHQLIAKAFGGQVDFHPEGIEIGTVPVTLNYSSHNDALFKELPRQFSAHATHSQTVIQLPETAVHLGKNDYEPNHAFRIGECIWGVQFHPEFNAEVMKGYIERQAEAIAKAGQEVKTLLSQVEETPSATQILRNFIEFARTR